MTHHDGTAATPCAVSKWWLTSSSAWTGWAASLAGRARRWAHRTLCAARLLGLLFRAWLRGGCGAGGEADRRAPVVYRVYIFNETAGRPGFFRETSPHAFDPDTWERDTREATDWPAFRVEVRYTYRRKKYRMVLRPGDKCVLFQDPTTTPEAPACRLPKGVLSARLQGPPGSDIDCDVTPRVLKYQGPRGDFHAGLGLRVRLQDMFPFDDNADNAARFTHLRLLDTMARVHDMPFAANMHMPAAAASRVI